MTFEKDSCIGVIDAGLGGLTLLGYVHRLFPRKDLVYLGDVRHMPYNVHDLEWIQAKYHSVVDHITTRTNHVLIGCNTMSVLDDLTHDFGADIHPLVPAVIQELKSRTDRSTYIVMATRTVIESGAYDITKLNGNEFFGVPCIYLATNIEKYGPGSPKIDETVREYLEPVLSQVTGPRLTVLLGCTHYVLVADQIRAYITAQLPEVELEIIDSGGVFASTLSFVEEDRDTGSIHLHINHAGDRAVRERIEQIMVSQGMPTYSLEFVDM